MNYQRIYENLINFRKNNKPSPGVYTEKHHIIPRCMGGTDDVDNIVELTAREHFIAHALLYKIHRTSRLAHAWFSMTRNSDNQQRNFTSSEYDMARRNLSESMKINMMGKNNPFYGKKHSQQTKKILSDRTKANGDRRTEEQITKWIETVAKKPKTEEHRKRISRPGFVILKNKLTGEVIRIDKDTKQEYDNRIWVNPAAISQKRLVCDRCGKESTAGNIIRWHNDKCKKEMK